MSMLFFNKIFTINRVLSSTFLYNYCERKDEMDINLKARIRIKASGQRALYGQILLRHNRTAGSISYLLPCGSRFLSLISVYRSPGSSDPGSLGSDSSSLGSSGSGSFGFGSSILLSLFLGRAIQRIWMVTASPMQGNRILAHSAFISAIEMPSMIHRNARLLITVRLLSPLRS